MTFAQRASLRPIVAGNLFHGEGALIGKRRQGQASFIGGILPCQKILLLNYRRELRVQTSGLLQKF
jgi:hypothetical protein